MATIYAAVYGISWAHQKMAMVSPTEHPLIKQMIKASKRIIGTSPINKKQPLGVEHVKKLVNKFGVGDLSNLQITCLVALGFSGFLRWDDLSQLRKEDFFIPGRIHFLVFLHKRNNDQHRERSWTLIARTSNLTCPVQLMEMFFRRGGHRPSDFVFRKISHTTTRMKLRKEQMTYSQARELFYKQLKGIGLDPSPYGLHHLRSGDATESAAWGILDHLIQRHGGWRSEVSMNIIVVVVDSYNKGTAALVVIDILATQCQ
ncbi:Integrase recombinase xerD-like, partial [Paramuricea clavata]